MLIYSNEQVGVFKQMLSELRRYRSHKDCIRVERYHINLYVGEDICELNIKLK